MVIFDLDGTISDPSVGIGRSINYALAAFDRPNIPQAEIVPYIGLPLEDIFRRSAPTATGETIRGMIAKYRERYADLGYAENEVYTGIPEALENLASRRVAMGVCTTKRKDFAERILTLFGLRSYFAFVCGGDVGVRKEEQLRSLIREGTADPDAAMVGDRAVDVTAARANGLRAVGVLWGCGSRAELRGAAPDQLLEIPDELRSLAHLAPHRPY